MPKIILNDNVLHDNELHEKSRKPVDSESIGLSKKQLSALVESGAVSLYVPDEAEGEEEDDAAARAAAEAAEAEAAEAEAAARAATKAATKADKDKGGK
jgi:hypothetical protein